MASFVAIEPTKTLDDIELPVMVNVCSREDVELAMERGTEGVELFRTEPFFLAAIHLPADKEFATFLLEGHEPAWCAGVA